MCTVSVCMSLMRRIYDSVYTLRVGKTSSQPDDLRTQAAIVLLDGAFTQTACETRECSIISEEGVGERTGWGSWGGGGRVQCDDVCTRLHLVVDTKWRLLQCPPVQHLDTLGLASNDFSRVLNTHTHTTLTQRTGRSSGHEKSK